MYLFELSLKKFLPLRLSLPKFAISKNVLLKSVIKNSSSITMYPSEILSTIFCNAIGVIDKNLNLTIANAKNITDIVKEIGVRYIVIGIPKTPAKLIQIGINEPININTDCLEKKPEFLIEYFIKYTNAINNNMYE